MTAINLADLHFFAEMPEESLSRFRAMAEEVTAQAGAILMEQGDVGREAFVVRSGQAAVLVAGQRIATVGPGSLLGEMALVDLRPRSATVQALTDLELLSFDADRFRAVLDELPEDKRAMLAAHTEAQRRENLDPGR